MAVKYVLGDLIKCAEAEMIDVMVHGCNTKKIMGAGIAKQIKEKYPKAYLMDVNCQYSEEQKLNGQFSYAIIDTKLIIVNAYIQDKLATRYGEIVVNYDALYKSLVNIRKEFTGLRFGLPWIGCGLAGGNWEGIVKPMIEKIFENEDTLVVEYMGR